MTDADRRYLEAVNRRVASMNTRQANAYREAIAIIQKELGSERTLQFIADGRIDDIITDELLFRANAPQRLAIRNNLEVGFNYNLPDIAALADVALKEVKQSVFFDVMNPRIRTAIEQMERGSLETLPIDIRETVRQVALHGAELAKHPDQIARELRQVIGLPPSRAQWVLNLQDQLRAGDRAFVERNLLTQRTKDRLLRYLDRGESIPESEIEKAVAEYTRKQVAYNAQVNTRLIALDSYRSARYEAYQSAIERGILDGDRARKRWVHSDTVRFPRPFHVKANGMVVPINDPYILDDGSNYLLAGEGDFGCLCSDVFFLEDLPVDQLSQF